MSDSSNKAILLIATKDQPGIIHTITSYILSINGNILDLEQYVDRSIDMFFMRVEWDASSSKIKNKQLRNHFQTEVADKRNINWQLYFSEKTPTLAIFVSKQAHCLFEIISRQKSNSWGLSTPIIISNHLTWKAEVEKNDMKFYYFDMLNKSKAETEDAQLELLEKSNIDFIVLARYMQILSPKIVDKYKNHIINIHHSFLPAFPGAKPYHQAFERGVKIIGATSHYVTNELDEGPIIEQDIMRISHNDSIDDLVSKGQDIEKLVLSRAIAKHIKRKILVYGNKTVVFD